MIVISCQEIVRSLKTTYLEFLEIFLQGKGFVNIEDSYNGMWEMFMIIFVKSNLQNEVSGVKKMQIAKGKMYTGAKGGVAYGLTFRGRHFNFFGVHLQHGPHKTLARHKMMSALVKEFKLFQIQSSVFKPLESDTYADYSFIMGDLNYRVNSTFMYMSRHIEETRNFNIEQLTIAKMNGFYPGYHEEPINWLPTYKLSETANTYVDKKDQCPSFTDRILFKNNTSQEVELHYDCLTQCFGSDHRPVTLDLVFKNFKTKTLVNFKNCDQIGVLAVDFIELVGVNWTDLKEMVGMKTKAPHMRLRL